METTAPVYNSARAEEELASDRLAALWRNYRGTIYLVLLAIAIGYTIVASVAYLLAPKVRVTEMEFRLTFRGADRGEYPNRTPFSAAEIVSPPVLLEVYQKNDLRRFMRLDDLKSSLVVVQSGEELEALTREFRAKLSDPKLTAVDRERIETQFQERKSAISQADYQIILSAREGVRRLPTTLRVKILNDVLSTWAAQTLNNKGASLYDVAILSGEVFDTRALATQDPVIALDLIRTKIFAVLSNIDALIDLPGAKVVRTDKTKRSLAELNLAMMDLRDYRVRPLVASLIASGASPTASDFLRTRLKARELDVEAAKSRIEAARSTLAAYINFNQPIGAEGDSAPSASEGNGGVVPQIDRSFLEGIVRLTEQSRDIEYRQRLTDSLQQEMMRLVPLESDVRYYNSLLSGQAGASSGTTLAAAQQQVVSIATDAAAVTEDVNSIYHILSKDLNPATILYSITTPATQRVERGISGVSLFIGGMVLLLLSFPVVLFGAALHERMSSSARRAAAR